MQMVSMRFDIFQCQNRRLLSLRRPNFPSWSVNLLPFPFAQARLYKEDFPPRKSMPIRLPHRHSHCPGICREYIKVCPTSVPHRPLSRPYKKMHHFNVVPMPSCGTPCLFVFPILAHRTHGVVLYHVLQCRLADFDFRPVGQAIVFLFLWAPNDV